jgi:hypothetical protein
VVSPVRVRVSPSHSPRSRIAARCSGRRGIDWAHSPSPVGKAWCLRFEFWPGIPDRDWVSRTRTEDTTAARVPDACPNRRLGLLRERRASRTARSSVASSQPGWAEPSARRSRLKPPVPRRYGRTHGPVGHARSDRGNQARAQHRRGRLRVVHSESLPGTPWRHLHRRDNGSAWEGVDGRASNSAGLR